MDEAERCTSLAYLAYGDLLVTGTVKEVITKTGLYTWEVTGNVTTSLLQRTKLLEGVTQAALFGNKIHICGYEPEKIEPELERLTKKYSIAWQPIESTLEDAFISLVKKTHGAMD